MTKHMFNKTQLSKQKHNLSDNAIFVHSPRILNRNKTMQNKQDTLSERSNYRLSVHKRSSTIAAEKKTEVDKNKKFETISSASK